MLRGLSILVLCLASPAVHAQVQNLDLHDTVAITSTTAVAVASVTAQGTGTGDVALSAHVLLEGAGFDYDDYQVAICKDSATGSHVGEAFWTPGDKTPTTQVFEGDTLFVTGFDHSVTLPATYVLCVSKISDTSPDLTAFVYGLSVRSAPVGATLFGTEAYGLVEVQTISSTSWAQLATITVPAPSASDVVLTAHVVVGGLGLGNGVAYEFGICKETAGGTLVGDTRWRPPLTASAGTSSGDTIALTGFDANVTGTLHYILCARKVDASAPTLTALELGLHAARAPTGTTAFGTEAIGTPLGATVDSGSFVTAASLDVSSGSAPYAVRLTAHAFVEGQNYDQHALYEFGICRGSATGPEVGVAFWRPIRMDSDTHYIADTLTLTGYDRYRTVPTTYVVCARKFDPSAPTVTIYPNGLVATVPEPGGAAPALVALGLLAALRARGLGRLSVRRAWMRHGGAPSR
jgi:hypothetical protein